MQLSRRARFAAMFAAVAVTATTFAASPSLAAPPASTPAVVAPALATATTTKSCSTGGYAYETDKMYVVRSGTTGNWKYTVTRSSNRTVIQETSTTFHTWKHVAKYLHVYLSSSSIKTISYPGNTTYIYSSSPYVDFRMVFELTVDGLWKSTRMCDIYF